MGASRLQFNGAGRVGAEANSLAVLSGCGYFREQKSYLCRVPPLASERHALRHLNMLMLQLGMNTTACISFATGDSVGGVSSWRQVPCTYRLVSAASPLPGATACTHTLTHT